VQVLAELLQLAELLPHTLDAMHMSSGVMAERARARTCKLAVVKQHALVQAWQLIEFAVLRGLLAACAAGVAVHAAGHGVVMS
jgi:hypothetical protein